MTTTDSTPQQRLSRESGHGRPAAPVRIVHVGLGNFFRAHQAWYTNQAPDAADWGIAAFTGRSAAMAEALNPQDGLYTLITRASDGDTFDVISSISAVHAAADHDAWLRYWSSPELAVVTLTVTEAGYMRAPGGALDTSRADVQADIAALRARPDGAAAATAPGRIVVGLPGPQGRRCRIDRHRALRQPPRQRPRAQTRGGRAHRRRRPDARRLGARRTSRSARRWSTGSRPATTDEHRAAVLAALGVEDASPVPTEPFSEWVIAGEFPKGRPAWDAAGAFVVDDVVPFEQRKLWLLNGSHSLLAYAGTILGHETVADAIADPVARSWVEQWWDEASGTSPCRPRTLPPTARALLDRFENPNIRHALAQIAADGSQKLPVRIVPTLRAERAAGRVPQGATRVIAAWTCHLRGLGAPVKDVRAADVAAFGEGTLEQSVSDVLGFLGEDLAADSEVVAAVLAHAEDLTGRS